LVRPSSIEELERSETVVRNSPNIVEASAAKTKREAVIRTLVREFEGKSVRSNRAAKLMSEKKKENASKDRKAEKSVNKSSESRVVV
jgi:hypothetical protein